MINNYLVTSLRNLLRDKFYVTINILGLAMGLATCLIIVSWIQGETSYDTYLAGSDRVFRVATYSSNSQEEGIASTYPMIKGRVIDQFPEVESSVRLFKADLLTARKTIAYEDKIFNDDILFYTDPGFFSVFPYSILKGDSKTPLQKPNAAVLTQGMAKKYFGETDPIGKIIVMGENTNLEVTAIMEDVPGNMHARFDLLVSMEAHPWVKKAEQNLWSGIVFHTYVKLKREATADDFERKITTLVQHLPADTKQFGKDVVLKLQPVQKIHLTSNLRFEFGANGDIRYVYVFLSVAVLVVLTATLNYINLASARYTRRYKEVGVRKVMGAQRRQLLGQFLLESVIMMTVALVVSISLLEFAQPLLFRLTGVPLPMLDLWNVKVLGGIAGVTMALGILAGLFPSVVLTSLQPTKLFKPAAIGSWSGQSVRKVLMGFQFTVTVFLIDCTLVAYQQIRLFSDRKLGYDRENIIVMHIGNAKLVEHYETLKAQVLQHSGVLAAAAVSQLPVNILEAEGVNSGDQRYEMSYMGVDRDFFKTMGMNVLAGADRIAEIRISDTTNNFVLNESAVRELGWEKENALARNLIIRHGDMKPGPVVGIVSDFHFKSLKEPMGPVVLEFKPYEYQLLLIRVTPGNSEEVLTYLNKTWKQLAGSYPVDFSFLDQDYDNLYQAEKKAGALFMVFAFIALFLSLLGLFALTAFSIEKRVKEIGLRKVLGASTSQVVGLLSREFVMQLLIAFLVSVPLCYYLMNEWLAGFAYKVTITPAVFLFAITFTGGLAWATVGGLGLKASRTNPAEALRSE